VQAIQNIYRYRRQVKGTIYKAALKNLAQGLIGVILLIIVLRCIESLDGSISRLGLAAILSIIYLLIICSGIGYAFIARGAKQLQRIEEL
jgi:hypothetical protein